MSWNNLEFLGIPRNSQNSGNSFRKGKELGLLFYSSPLSVSVSFTFLKLFLYTQYVVRILYLVRVLYPVRNP